MASSCRLKPQATRIYWHAHVSLTVPLQVLCVEYAGIGIGANIGIRQI